MSKDTTTPRSKNCTQNRGCFSTIKGLLSTPVNNSSGLRRTLVRLINSRLRRETASQTRKDAMHFATQHTKPCLIDSASLHIYMVSAIRLFKTFAPLRYAHNNLVGLQPNKLTWFLQAKTHANFQIHAANVLALLALHIGNGRLIFLYQKNIHLLRKINTKIFGMYNNLTYLRFITVGKKPVTKELTPPRHSLKFQVSTKCPGMENKTR